MLNNNQPQAYPAIIAPRQVRPRIPVIDGVRALAMLMVFTCHVGLFSGWPALSVSLAGHRADLGPLVWSGANGVDLFMVLSGFCLFLPLCGADGRVCPKWDWRKFYRRRATRILPAYYGAIVFAVVFPFALVAAFKAVHLPAKWQPLEAPMVYVQHILFLQTLVPSTFGKINAAFWSMGLEVQFYLVFPLVVAACRRSVSWSLTAMAVTSVVYLAIVIHVTRDFRLASRRLFPIFFLGRWVQFASGMAAAWLVMQATSPRRTTTGKTGSLILAGCFLGYVASCCCPPSRYGGVIQPVGFALIFGAALYALCATPTIFRRPLEHPVVVWLGYISYSIFLLHWPVIYYISQLASKAAHLSGWPMAVALVLIGLPCVVAVAWVSFHLLERPFLGHRERPGQASKPTGVQILKSASPVVA